MPIRPIAVDDARAVTDLNEARRVVDMAPAITLLEDDKKSLMTFLDSLGVRKVTNHRFNWLTDAHVPKTHEVGVAAVPAWDAGTPADLGALTAGGIPADGVYLRPKDVVRFHDTGELARVIAPITNMEIITIAQLERNVDGALAPGTGAVAAGGLVTLIGSATEENSVLRVGGALNSITTQVRDNFNVTQTFRDPVGLSRREMEANLYGGKDRPYQRMKKLLEHCQQIENAFWHSSRIDNSILATLPGDETVTLTGGMIEAIRNYTTTPGSNVFAAGGVLTEDDFNQILRVFSRYGNTNKKVLFASRFVCETISNFLRKTGGDSVYQLNESASGKKSIGVEVTSYMSGTGFTVDIVPTHALEGRGGEMVGTGGAPFVAPDAWDGLAVMIDPENVKCAKYGDTYLKLETDVQLPDQDGVVDSYISDVGLQWGMPEHHLLLEGITG